MKKQEIMELQLDNNFILKIRFTKDDWTTVIISKEVNGEKSKDILTASYAAVLKYAIDCAILYPNQYINKSLDWPTETEIRPRTYKRVKSFLGKYGDYFETVRRKGVIWKGSTKLVSIEEKIPQPPRKPDPSEEGRQISPQMLWNAGHRKYEKIKAEHLLHIDEQIMPFYSKDHENETTKGVKLPISVRIDDSRNELPLCDAIGTKQGSLYLIGEGGIGKTTALMSIMDQHYQNRDYDQSEEIPLFVELSRAPRSFNRWYDDSEEMTSSFIRMEICRQTMSLEKLQDVSDEMIECITEEFKILPDNGQPRYLLLLDGLNEVSMSKVTDTNPNHQTDSTAPTEIVRSLIIREINYLITECPNVRIILTSRTNEAALSCNGKCLQKLYLTGLKKEMIQKYLLSKDISQDETDAIVFDSELLECIKIPLFLVIYADLYNRNGVSSRGEILHQFFHERGANIAYCQQDAIKKMKVDMYHLWFILDFLIPAIGSAMEQNERFEMSAKEIGKIIEPILKGWKPTLDGAVPTDEGEPYDASVTGDYGKACFYKYTSGRNNVETVAEDILKKGKTITKVAEYVLECATDVLKILCCDKNEYSFIHHHLRDYFAAMHDINTLRIALYAQSKIPEIAFESLSLFVRHANHPTKSIFIGEILGEHHNKPYLKNEMWHYNVPDKPCERNLIKCALDIFRGRFGDEVGYGVYNLIEILKLVRRDLSGEDLSRLSLSQIILNGTDLGKCGCSALLTGARVGHNTLFPIGHSSSANSASFNKDSTRIVTASDDGTAKIWDATTGALLLELAGHSGSVRSAAYNSDGTRIVTASDDGTARVWDADTGKYLLELATHSFNINSATYNNDNTRIVTASGNHIASVWEAETGTHLFDLIGHNGSVRSAAYDNSNTRIVTASGDSTAKVWDAKTGAHLFDLKGHSFWIRSATYNRSGTRIVTASWDNTAKVWDAVTGTYLFNLIGHKDCVNFAAYNSDGTRIVTASQDRTAKVWDAITGAYLFDLKGHSDCVTSAAYNSDGTRIVTSSGDGSAKVWDAVTGALLLDINGYKMAVNTASYNRSGSCVVTSSDDGTAKVWNEATGSYLFNLTGHNSIVTSATYNSDGTRIVTASQDCTAKIWDAVTGVHLLDLKGHSDIVTSASYNSNDTRIVTSSNDGMAKVWDANTGDHLFDLKGHSGVVTFAAYNSDGTRIVTASQDCTAKVWDAETGAHLLDLKGHSSFLTSASYNGDSTHIVTSSLGHTVKIWDAKTGEMLREITGHSIYINSAAYNRDGTRIVTSSGDHTAKVWNTETGSLILTLTGHSGAVRSATFNKDGTHIATASSDGTSKVWDAESGECLKTLPSISGLVINGVDLRNIHPSSALSETDRTILRQYGAIVN